MPDFLILITLTQKNILIFMMYILKYLGVKGRGACDSLLQDSGKIKETEKAKIGEKCK